MKLARVHRGGSAGLLADLAQASQPTGISFSGPGNFLGAAMLLAGGAAGDDRCPVRHLGSTVFPGGDTVRAAGDTLAAAGDAVRLTGATVAGAGGPVFTGRGTAGPADRTSRRMARTPAATGGVSRRKFCIPGVVECTFRPTDRTRDPTDRISIVADRTSGQKRCVPTVTGCVSRLAGGTAAAARGVSRVDRCVPFSGLCKIVQFHPFPAGKPQLNITNTQQMTVSTFNHSQTYG